MSLGLSFHYLFSYLSEDKRKTESTSNDDNEINALNAVEYDCELMECMNLPKCFGRQNELNEKSKLVCYQVYDYYRIFILDAIPKKYTGTKTDNLTVEETAGDNSEDDSGPEEQSSKM